MVIVAAVAVVTVDRRVEYSNRSIVNSSTRNRNLVVVAVLNMPSDTRVVARGSLGRRRRVA